MVAGVNASAHQVLFKGQAMPPASGGKARPADSRGTKDQMVHALTGYNLAFSEDLPGLLSIRPAHLMADPELPNPDGLIDKGLVANGWLRQICCVRMKTAG